MLAFDPGEAHIWPLTRTMASPPDSRTSRFAGGLAMAVANHALMLLVGLWLTRFVLARVGQTEYGLWLVALQVMAYLALTDLGVVAVLPREAAFAAGRADAAGALPRLVGETARLALWQTPLVALAAAAIWMALPEAWSPLRPVLAAALLAFVVTFPLRLYQGLLQGLQDLRFLGQVQLGVWVVSTLVVVGLLLGGARLSALAAGWVVTQVMPPAIYWWRLRRRYPEALPAALPPLDLDTARPHLARALWVSLNQVGQLLLSGADVLIVGLLLGPNAVVLYVMTGKLIAVAANLPSMIAQTAGPGLSELRVRESRERRLQVATALMQAVLLLSGLIACVVLLVNQRFVTWWVGGHLYGGGLLTALLVALMLLRHWGTAVVFTVYSFGHERRLALTGLAEGAVTVACTAIGVRWLGLIGAPIGALVGIAAVALPSLLPVLASETGSPVPALLRRHLPWAWRFAILAVAVHLLRDRIPLGGIVSIAAWAILTAGLCGAVMLPMALRPPLRTYALQGLDTLWPMRVPRPAWLRTGAP